MNIHIERLSGRLGYTFKDLSLLNQALTHRSFNSINNERLEFLGDALLGATIAEQLYKRCPVNSEGSLTRIRASLVKKETLADVARELDIGPLLNLGGGELKSGGARRDSILGDALEAIIGAIYLDGGMTACRQAILRWFETRLEQQVVAGSRKDAKTTLQEYLQARGEGLPEYRLVETSGEPHQQLFRVVCALPQRELEIAASGKSKRAAEKQAAEKMLMTLRGAGQ